MAILEANTQQAKRGRSSKVKGSEMVLASTQTNTKKQALHNVSVKSESNKRKRGTVVNDGVKSKAMIRAIEIQASLSSEFPSLIKYMQPSHVSGGFWLGLCKKFCDEHLPNEDTVIVLEDGNGKSSQTKYLAHKSGLSGGWRGFSIDHNLVEGDVLVFHLVKPTKFKVYVVKANSAEEVDGALAILKFDSCIKQMNPYHAEAEMEYQDLEHLYLTNPEENNTMPGISNIRLISDHSENESGDFGFEITDGIRMSETVVDFKEVRSFEDFDILANGLVINCELSKHLQMKYYELCCSQKCFLHENFIEGLNCKLIAGIISETINIADAIRASKVTTSYDNFTTWEKTLKAFLGLGMKVDFLLARLEQLINLSAKSERHKKARLEKDNAENEMRILEAKISGVEETMNRLDVVVETLEVNAENLELRFQELAKAPW
ncbi:B3 domain-containing protein Os01g0234100-like isoform X1 [Populus nigra]|uniref:B3 domain-containing protein Os01g0234100-like isoform X1 n=1 Tax=Populus nigra TaxID=3691 RepID=UPI002B26E011|nr:B3 domain-containing protein Os01g0234100-like isoform X1 [Populus nigra]